jgi:hypothetical protein
MEQQNFINTLRSFYRERPFRQFDVELASGETVRVVHPDAMAFIGQRAIVLTTDGLHHHFDHHGVVRISETDEGPSTAAHGLKDNGLSGN